jgi:hypothetical protein
LRLFFRSNIWKCWIIFCHHNRVHLNTLVHNFLNLLISLKFLN